MVGKLEINIKKNAMAVMVSIMPNGDTDITDTMLKEELQMRGVVAGIDNELLKEIANHGIYKKVYIVAQGVYATRGKAGYYEFLFDKNIEQNAPRIREDGSVDYSPMIQMVEEGQLLATYHHAEQGENGYTVLGAAIAPAPAKEQLPLVCKNVEQRGDNYYAGINGRVSLEGNRLEVKNHLVIEGDVGYHMRNVAFSGDIHVHGDILTNVELKVEGSVEVDGVVEGATVIAGKDIVVHQGIHGMGKAVIQAGGSLTTNFIEEAEVTVDGDVLVDHIINADITARNGIYAKGKNGQIIGGKMNAGLCDAYQIGNEKGVKTSIRVGCEDFHKKETSMLIVRKRMYEGTRVAINNMQMEETTDLFGEFHCIGDQITKCNVGEFRYSEQSQTTEQQDKPQNIRKSRQKPLVLVVDDEPVVLRNEYKYLVEDYRVGAVGTAKDALAFLEKAKPDLILLDYMMPQMNGGELLERIRKLPDRTIANIPVFFLTGVTDRKIIMECMKLYPQGYLLKPLGKSELLKILSEFFAKNNTEA